VLLHLIIKGSFRRNIIALNSLLIKIAFFAVCNRANNSAFVLNVVTIPCLFALQAIGPLNSFIIYPSYTDRGGADWCLAVWFLIVYYR